MWNRQNHFILCLFLPVYAMHVTCIIQKSIPNTFLARRLYFRTPALASWCTRELSTMPLLDGTRIHLITKLWWSLIARSNSRRSSSLCFSALSEAAQPFHWCIPVIDALMRNSHSVQMHNLLMLHWFANSIAWMAAWISALFFVRRPATGSPKFLMTTTKNEQWLRKSVFLSVDIGYLQSMVFIEEHTVSSWCIVATFAWPIDVNNHELVAVHIEIVATVRLFF